MRHLLAAILIGLVATTAHAAPEKVSGFGENPGNLGMYKYVPAGLPAGAPLVVALHGCTQSAADYDDEPGWLELADRHRFAVLLPEQDAGNQDYKCFNWFEQGDQQRGKGEPASIVSMVDKMIADHGIDPARVYASGLSGGGSMVAVLLATYPDRFVGGAIIGGIPFKCADDAFESLSCAGGEDKSPQSWGEKVRKAHTHAGPAPKVSIWHGNSDIIVAFKNAGESLEQWTDVHGIEPKETSSETVAGHKRQVFSKNGAPVIELWTVQGLGHGTPIAPGTGPEQCGRKSEWAKDVGICSSHHIAKFWGLLRAD